MRHVIEKILLMIVLIFLVILGVRAFFLDFSAKKVAWGVSFDPYYAKDLGFDPQKVYSEILTDLRVSNIRLTAHWNKIEAKRGTYDWSMLDWQVKQAKEKNVKVILAIGRKLPRWPECYQPDWWSDLTPADAEQELLDIVRLTVERYRGYDNIIAWQVENEPLVGWFGVCPAPNKAELEKEIALTKKTDPSRLVVVTDSGELSTWLRSAGLGDILGTTMYRVVWDKYFGFWTWPLPPSYYYYKTKIVSRLTNLNKVIVTELQAEPWSNVPIQLYPLDQQYKSMSAKQFAKNINYAQKAGFDTIYLWGAEWWYWMKEKNSNDFYWQEAKKLWAD